MRLVVAATAVLAGAALGAPAGDKVTTLPGWTGPFGFNLYAGYIDVDPSPHTKHMFYMFAESQHAPATDPLLLWMTGGPGCSSLLALMTENGPFTPTNSSPPQLASNPFSWNLNASVIFLESPVGVGFSYADDGNYTTGDDETSRVALEFVKGWFAAYPEYLGHQFFISGESYSGHYTPQLVARIDSFNTGGGTPRIPLQGWLVGNPSWYFFDDANYYFPFVHAHALTSTSLFNQANAVCNGSFIGQVSPACATLVTRIRNDTIGINPYNVYAPCVGQPSLDGGCFTQDLARGGRPVQRDDGSITMQALDPPAVKAALHVSPKVTAAWDVCSQVVNYQQYAPTVADIYLALKDKYRILVYSGDVDTCVVFWGTLVNADALGLPVIADWDQWYYGGQIAGYIRKYQTKQDFAFVTIKGAGHMVPTFKPPQAKALLDAFLFKQPPFVQSS